MIARNLVIRITVAAGDREVLDERVTDDRHLDFGEQLANIEAARNRYRRTTLTGEIARLELDVGLRLQGFLAVLGADVEADAAVRPRRLQSVFATLERHVRVGDGLVNIPAQETGGREEVHSLLSHSADLEHIIGDASNVRGAAQGAAAHGQPGSRVRDDIERLVQTADGEVVQVGLRQTCRAELVISIIGQAAKQVAFHAADDAIRGMLEVVSTSATLDVPAVDLEPRVRNPIIGIDELVCREAHQRLLLRRHQRVVAVDDGRVSEIA